MKRRRRNACLASLETVRLAAPRLGLREVTLFLYVCENEGVNIAELAQLTRLEPSVTSRCVKRLCSPSAGLIHVKVNRADERGRLVSLSEKGAELRDKIENIIAESHPIRVLETG